MDLVLVLKKGSFKPAPSAYSPRRTRLPLLVLISVLSAIPLGRAVIINFEGLGAPGNGTRGLDVGNKYPGGPFSDPTALDYSKGTPVLPGFAPSGTTAAELCYQAAEFTCTAPLIMDFSAPQARVRIWAGSSEEVLTDLTFILRCFDASSVQLGQATATLGPSGSFIPIATPLEVTLSSAGIVKATAGYLETEENSGVFLNNFLAVDDVEFDAPNPRFISHFSAYR